MHTRFGVSETVKVLTREDEVGVCGFVSGIGCKNRYEKDRASNALVSWNLRTEAENETRIK